jgi:hypothetical protein
MIHNLKHPNRKKNPARLLKDMEQELNAMRSRWKEKTVSERALKEYPEFARGYLTLLHELLCVPFDASQFKDLPKK